MDKYLQPNSAYNRLLAEYKTHGCLHVGYDFDSTVHDYHKTGESYEMVRQLIRDLKEIGCKTYCWTAYKDLDYVVQFLKENNIPFDGINTNAIPLGWDSRKPFFSCLLDDRAGLKQVYNDLTKLVREVKTKTFYRVCHENTKQGLWYCPEGTFTGLIHDKFKFCKNSTLEMHFDEELTGWLSATESLEDLMNWFSEEDIKELQKHGWFIFEYAVKDYKFYDRFQHYIINQETSIPLNKIEL